MNWFTFSGRNLMNKPVRHNILCFDLFHIHRNSVLLPPNHGVLPLHGTVTLSFTLLTMDWTTSSTQRHSPAACAPWATSSAR